MPKLNDPTINTENLNNSHFGYSGVGIGNLGATEYTLVTILVDVSSSVAGFLSDLENSISSIVNACQSSPRSDNLLVRLVEFSSDINEIHGFKMLENCKSDDYYGVLKIGGMTKLVDASYNAIEATKDYAAKLYDNDFDVNAIVFIITDGADNDSSKNVSKIKNIIEECRLEEKTDSLITVLVGVGTKKYSDLSAYLSSFKQDANLDQYVNVGEATAGKLAKLADFVSKSVSAQSESIGSKNNKVSQNSFLEI